MPYAAVKWKPVAVLMRDSAYAILEALTTGPKSWTELKKAASLTDGGVQKVLQELIRFRVVEQRLVGETTAIQEKKYVLSDVAKKEKVYEKARDLKQSMEKIAKT